MTVDNLDELKIKVTEAKISIHKSLSKGYENFIKF